MPRFDLTQWRRKVVENGAPPKMTLADFCSWLRQSPKPWSFRSRSKILRDAKGRCPIVAVCLLLTGRNFSVVNWKRAAALIRLPPRLTKSIMRAADDVDGPRWSAIRQRLLDATTGRTTTNVRGRVRQDQRPSTPAAFEESPEPADTMLVGAATE